MKLLFVALTALSFVSQVAAAEQPLTDKVILKDIGRAMENAAGEFDLATRISAGICTTASPTSCTFKGEGRLKIVGTAPSEDASPIRISLEYKPDGLTWPLPINVALLVSVAEPTMTEEKRQELFARIMEATMAERSEAMIAGRNAVFSVKTVGTQIVVTAKAIAQR